MLKKFARILILRRRLGELGENREVAMDPETAIFKKLVGIGNKRCPWNETNGTKSGFALQ